MKKKWKPTKTQRKAFALQMSDPTEKAVYLERKRIIANRRRAASIFDYETAGSFYVPTKAQHDFCFNNFDLFTNPEDINAANIVMAGYACNEQVHHDHIHVVNQIIRKLCKS